MNETPTTPPPYTPLMRRWLLNLVLLVVVAGLAIVAWRYSSEEKKDVRAVLTDVKPDAVRRIEIRQSNQPPIVIEKINDHWRLTAPLKARGNGFTIGDALRLLQAPTEGQVKTADDQLARFGLEKPALIVRLDDTTIEFGTMHPLKNQHYVRHGAAVHLISSHYYAQAARAYTHFIDSRLIEEGRKPIAFKLPGFALTFADGVWRRTPEDKALSSDRINDFVEEWRNARALSVTAANTPPTDLATAPGSRGRSTERITITFADDSGAKPELVLAIIARKPELVLLRSDEGLEYHFPEETGQRLLMLNAANPK